MQPEAVVRSERPFSGRLIRVRVDTVRLADGSERQREVVEHPGAVGILPVLNDGALVLVRQYRHAVGRTLLEIPAGTREPGEDAEACAHRELAEETGYRAGELRELVRFYVSPGWADEELIVYLADDLEPGSAHPAEDERLSLVEVRPEEVGRLIRQGQIADSKTIVALLAYLGLPLGQLWAG
ncbi:MAG: NUDIX hydrolase [Sphaerobacter sp.]|nr:NUDIX hydrolase [Sphaerobacter sp.]